MAKEKQLLKYVKASLFQLRFEKMIYTAQSALFIAMLSAVIIFTMSRLFVFPYYERIAWVSVLVVLVLFVVLAYFNRVKRDEAVKRLDAYMPDNLLMTALSISNQSSPLVLVVLNEAVSKVEKAFLDFRKRKKRLIHTKMLIGIGCASIVLVLLALFPSEAQLEAQIIVKEKEIHNKMKKDIQKLAEKEEIPTVKKELEDLKEKMVKADSSGEALKEIVKKQKELRLEENRLDEKEKIGSESKDGAEGLTVSEKELQKQLSDLANELARQASKSNSALNEIGKAPQLPELAQALEGLTKENDEMTTGENSNGNMSDSNKSPTNIGEGQNSNDGQKANQEGSSGEGKSSDEADGQTGGQGTGQNPGEGQGQGPGPGQGQGPGQGNGAGQGQGNGAGIGAGPGGRDLLTIPYERTGEKGNISTDKGQLNEGDYIEREVEGGVEKGTIRPYEEVVGDYQQSYLESMEKMKLPAELQRVLSDYFGSLD